MPLHGPHEGLSAPIRRWTLYDTAAQYVGLRELPGALDSPVILAMLQLDAPWYEHDEVPWCSAALNWWAWNLGLPRSRSPAARSWLGVGRAIPLNILGRGYDIVVLYRGSPESLAGHVGIFDEWSEDGGELRLLGGNQGDGVNVSQYPIERVLGCRRLWPDAERMR